MKPKPQTHFDADAMAAANEEPTLTVGSLLYYGRIFSALEWLAWNDRFAAISAQLKSGNATVYDLLAFYRAYFTDLFPRRRRRFWAPNPVDALMQQPYKIIQETFNRFFALQAQANGVTVPGPATSPPTKTHGTSSSASTPDVTDETNEVVVGVG